MEKLVLAGLAILLTARPALSAEPPQVSTPTALAEAVWEAHRADATKALGTLQRAIEASSDSIKSGGTVRERLLIWVVLPKGLRLIDLDARRLLQWHAAVVQQRRAVLPNRWPMDRADLEELEDVADRYLKELEPGGFFTMMREQREPVQRGLRAIKELTAIHRKLGTELDALAQKAIPADAERSLDPSKISAPCDAEEIYAKPTRCSETNGASPTEDRAAAFEKFKNALPKPPQPDAAPAEVTTEQEVARIRQEMDGSTVPAGRFEQLLQGQREIVTAMSNSEKVDAQDYFPAMSREISKSMGGALDNAMVVARQLASWSVALRAEHPIFEVQIKAARIHLERAESDSRELRKKVESLDKKFEKGMKQTAARGDSRSVSMESLSRSFSREALKSGLDDFDTTLLTLRIASNRLYILANERKLVKKQ